MTIVITIFIIMIVIGFRITLIIIIIIVSGFRITLIIIIEFVSSLLKERSGELQPYSKNYGPHFLPYCILLGGYR